MPYFEGIYGYEISKRFELKDLIIHPLHEDFKAVEDLAQSVENYFLTGIIEYKKESTAISLFDLEGILAFIDRMDVIITNKDEFSNLKSAKSNIPNKLYLNGRQNGDGQLIASDNFFENNYRAKFINSAINQLSEENNSSVLRKAFFKSIEPFRARRPFLEISYYLYYSALESLARFDQNNSECRNSNIPINNFLQYLGFNVRQNFPEDLERSIASYTHLRNALFHNSKLEKEIKCNSKKVTLKMKDYHGYLKRLVPLSILKYMGYDDGKRRWKSWYDRMPY
jgi:hypothetical protein